ncbi:MAG: ATP-binding cassette domain-containing protein [Oligoflexales bacterium]
MNISVKKLEKKYPEFQLGPLNFEWEQGQNIVIIGGNGAGKSTLFQILTGQKSYDCGQVYINKQQMTTHSHELKKSIGYLPQNLTLPPWSTPLEVLNYVRHLHSSKQSANELLKIWDCHEFANKPLNMCSHGMHKRVGLALCTIHDPSILILDEPFSGLDLYHLKTLHQLLEARHSQGLMTILATHIAPYAARYAQQAWHMNQGSLTQVKTWPTLTTDKKITLMEETFS